METNPEQSFDLDLMFSDQESMKKLDKTSIDGATVIVVNGGQKAQLNCPLMQSSSISSLKSSKKMLPSSSSSSSSSTSSSSSSTTATSSSSPIKWLKENIVLPQDHRQHVQSNGTLIISSAQKRLDEGIYYCFRTDSFNSISESMKRFQSEKKDLIAKNSAILQLKVIDLPRVGPYEFPSDLQVGMKARAMCSVMQGDPPFRFLWLQDNHHVESDVPTDDTGAIFRTQNFRDYSLLTVDSLTLSHAGNITCIVSNDAGKMSQSSMLKVNGVNTWEYAPIYNAAHYYLHPNGSLSIKSATQAQAGPYICQSTNGYGADIGKLIHLKINEPPRFQVPSITQSAQKGKPVRLFCPPEGDRPIHMEWFLMNGSLLNDLQQDLKHQTRNSKTMGKEQNDFHQHYRTKIPENNNEKFTFEVKEVSYKFLNGEINNLDSSDFDSNDDQIDSLLNDLGAEQSDSQTNLVISVLTIHQTSRDDSLVYVCKATNEFGWAEYRIQLIVKEKPDVPEEFMIVNVTESKAEIRWRESFNGNSAIVNYLVEYRRVDGSSSSMDSFQSSPSSSSSRSIALKDGDSGKNALGTGSSSTLAEISSVTIPSDRIINNGSTRWAFINDLRPNTLYHARIAAQNRLGQSDFSAWIRFRTEQSAPESPPLEVSASPTGPNSVKITWQSPKKSSWNGEISGYYIGYRAEKSDTDLYKTVENGNTNGGGKHESHITNLHRSTVYKAWVQAFNTRGTGPRSEIVSVQTLADVPPSAPLLRLHSSTSDSITLSWSSSQYGSRSLNDLTLYYRAYQPQNGEHPLSPGANIIHNLPKNIPNNWRDITIMEPSGRHTVSGLECGRSYEFFATAHNSVGKSEPSTPLVARTRGEAPTPPPRNSFISEISPNEVMLNLLSWKHNECPINHFSLRIRPRSSTSVITAHHLSSTSSHTSNVGQQIDGNNRLTQAWSILSMQHSPRENFLLKKLKPNTIYEIEITAHSSAGSTQVIHQFHTPSNGTESFLNKIGYDSKMPIAAYPMPSSSSEISFSDYEILLPVISSLIVVVVIVAVACFLCSRDHHSLFLQSGLNSRQPQGSAENKVPFHHQQEMSILKELVQSNSLINGPNSNGVGSLGVGDNQNDSLMMMTTTVTPNGPILHSEDDYNCLASETNSMIKSDLNHLNQIHHHHLINSPRHHLPVQKDLVELQSFLNQQQPPPPANRLNQSNNSNQTSRQSNSNTGNYALPYDVLPSQCRDNNGNSNGNLNPNSLQSTTNLINSVASVTFQQQPQHHQQSQSIYGQRLGGVTSTSNAVSSIIKSLPLPIGTNQGCNVTPASNASCQQNGLIEPLYATTKLINGSRGSNGTNTANITFNYCPKIEEICKNENQCPNTVSSSSISSSSSGSNRANYESLVPTTIICANTDQLHR
ncbi:Down syndrome cell adhesion molecule-like protein 1 -like protein [Sarcoptes scabiei]|uniref:Down syndrome cell adhesion molecule-like protein 1 -like protein n=1 Tax=Sarcoptes scabiei TaxID=52283 RepID=A0A834R3T1_SARSC|nr:Down syndrome cell adhesion molecule-like protein 1 -like protein [Sarcoptes scabiei]